MPWSINTLGPVMVVNGNITPWRWWSHASTSTVQKRKRPIDLSLPASQTDLYRQEIRYKNSTVVLPGIGLAPLLQYVPMSASFNESTALEEVASAKRSAAGRARARLKDQTWNAAQTFAELGKTMSFFVESARDLLHVYRLAKRGDVFGMSDWYRHYDYRGKGRKPPYVRVANRWLQWRYAVQPAVWDLQDALNELYRSPTQSAVTQTEGSARQPVFKVVHNTSYYKTWPSMVERSGTVRCKYIVRHRMTKEVTDWKRLGLLNLPALLWELTPGSFLFDRVINVGQWLNGLDAAVGTTVEQVLYVEKHAWGEYCHFGGAVQSSVGKSYGRNKTTLPDQPLPRFRPMYPEKEHLIDVLALLTQAAAARGLGVSLGRRQ